MNIFCAGRGCPPSPAHPPSGPGPGPPMQRFFTAHEYYVYICICMYYRMFDIISYYRKISYGILWSPLKSCGILCFMRWLPPPPVHPPPPPGSPDRAQARAQPRAWPGPGPCKEYLPQMNIVLSFAPSAAAVWHCERGRITCERNSVRHNVFFKRWAEQLVIWRLFYGCFVEIPRTRVKVHFHRNQPPPPKTASANWQRWKSAF